MSIKTLTSPSGKPTTTSSKQVVSALLGNMFEHYDTALYGLLSPFLAPLFFPQQDPIVSLLLAYALIPLGMMARPLGAWVIGSIGDKYGRTRALSYSLFGMALVSLFMAICPTFEQAGFYSPLFLGINRILSNFLSAGESMGGAIYILENTPEKKHDWLSGLYNSSTMGGIVIASIGVSILCSFSMIESGWRILYALGCITGFYGFYLRKQAEIKAPLIKRKNSLAIIKENFRPFFKIFLASGFSYANYSIAFLLTSGLIPLISSYTAAEMANMNSALLAIDLFLLPVFGWLAARYSREKIMLFAALSIAITSLPLFAFLSEMDLTLIFIIRTFIVIYGVAFSAPFHAWAQAQVPNEHRYFLISLAYALGSQIIGGPTALISLWLFKVGGTAPFASIYWLFLSLGISFFLFRQMAVSSVKTRVQVELT